MKLIKALLAGTMLMLLAGCQQRPEDGKIQDNSNNFERRIS